MSSSIINTMKVLIIARKPSRFTANSGSLIILPDNTTETQNLQYGFIDVLH
jgi:hypothetical protein